MNEEKENVCFGGLRGYGITYCEMIRLQKENKELHKKIDKAIKYIETATIDPQSMRHYRNCLLEILKDNDVE